MGRYLTSALWILHGSSSMLAGSVIGVPGPVAMMRPPCTWRLSSAVGGRYSPTLVRSSPSSGEISTRSPTTIRRLGVSSSRMGNSIRLRGKAVSPDCDADHRSRLTGRRRSLSMCPGRSGVRLRHRFPRPPRPVPTPVREHRHATAARHCADRAVELDSPDGVGLDLGGPVVDRRLAALVFRTVLSGDSFWQIVGKVLLLFFPATVLVLGVWGTLFSLYTIPFRSGRGRFLAALLMSWWDAVRMAWFYWFGLARFLLVFVGSIWGLLRLGVGLFWRTVKSLVMSPFAMLDSSSRQPGVPWIAFVLLLFWSAIEATIFTFTLRPTMSELLSDLTGYQVNALALVVLLWFFLFEVLFLYRELIDAITPWLAQQGFQLGIVGTLGLALLGWVGVRGMTWF